MQSGIRIPDDEREQARGEFLSQMHDALVASIAELKDRGALAASVSDEVRTALEPETLQGLKEALTLALFLGDASPLTSHAT